MGDNDEGERNPQTRITDFTSESEQLSHTENSSDFIGVAKPTRTSDEVDKSRNYSGRGDRSNPLNASQNKYIREENKYSGISLQHSDDTVTASGPIESEYGTETLYTVQSRELSKRENGEGYGFIGKRGETVEISRPADDVDTLEKEKYLEAQFHRHNRDKWTDHELANDGEGLFHVEFADRTPEILAYVDFDIELSDRQQDFLSLLLLMETVGSSPWNTGQFSSFRREHFEELTPESRSVFGLGPNEEFPTYQLYTIAGKLSDADTERFEEACTRLIFSLYRQGVVLPDTVSEAFELPCGEHTVNAEKMENSKIREGLRRWIEFFFNENIDPIDFGRGTNTQHSVQALLGLLATSALNSAGVQEAARLAEWHYPKSNIPSGKHLQQNLIERVPVSRQERLDVDVETYGNAPSVDEQFNEVHQITFRIAQHLDIIDGAQLLAIDTTQIVWEGNDDAPTIKAEPRLDTDSTDVWEFVVLAMVSNKSRLTLGTRLISDGLSDHQSAVKSLLNEIPSTLSIERLLVDAGELSGALLDKLDSVVGPDWLAKAPEYPPIKELIHVTPSTHASYTYKLPYNQTNEAGVTAFAYPHNRFIKFDDDAERRYASLEGTVHIPSKDIVGKNHYLHESEPDEQNNLSDFEIGADPHTPPLVRYVQDQIAGDTLPQFLAQDTHKPFFTGMDPEEHTLDIPRIQYHQRWAIEQIIKELKHHTRPITQSNNPSPQLFFHNIAVMFQNWHVVINRAPVPGLGYRLNVTYHQVLKAIQDVAFNPDET